MWSLKHQPTGPSCVASVRKSYLYEGGTAAYDLTCLDNSKEASSDNRTLPL